MNDQVIMYNILSLCDEVFAVPNYYNTSTLRYLCNLVLLFYGTVINFSVKNLNLDFFFKFQLKYLWILVKNALCENICAWLSGEGWDKFLEENRTSGLTHNKIRKDYPALIP